MARTDITAQAVSSTGLSPTLEPANVEGNAYVLRKGRVLRVKNGSASPITVTLPTPGTIDGLAVTDRTVAVPATTGDVFISLGRGDAYRQSGGKVHVDYSAVTSVTVAVLDVS